MNQKQLLNRNQHLQRRIHNMNTNRTVHEQIVFINTVL
jgi:hypothetical protein